MVGLFLYYPLNSVRVESIQTTLAPGEDIAMAAQERESLTTLPYSILSILEIELSITPSTALLLQYFGNGSQENPHLATV